MNSRKIGVSLNHPIPSNCIKIQPGHCDLVSWSILLYPKICGFDSHSGHTPRLQAQSQVQTHMEGNQ